MLWCGAEKSLVSEVATLLWRRNSLLITWSSLQLKPRRQRFKTNQNVHGFLLLFEVSAVLGIGFSDSSVWYLQIRTRNQLRRKLPAQLLGYKSTQRICRGHGYPGNLNAWKFSKVFDAVSTASRNPAHLHTPAVGRKREAWRPLSDACPFTVPENILRSWDRYHFRWNKPGSISTSMFHKLCSILPGKKTTAASAKACVVTPKYCIYRNSAMLREYDDNQISKLWRDLHLSQKTREERTQYFDERRPGEQALWQALRLRHSYLGSIYRNICGRSVTADLAGAAEIQALGQLI